jgi:HEPN domain-containing protein
MDEDMRELVQIWLKKAQHDLTAARRLAEGPDPVLDVAIYHCQQAAEKAVRGFLVSRDIRFERIHDIKILMQQASLAVPAFTEWIERADRLTDYAAQFRYPGEDLDPDREEFQRALEDAEAIYRFVIASLPESSSH